MQCIKRLLSYLKYHSTLTNTVGQKAEGTSVKSEPEMCSSMFSTSELDNAMYSNNAHSTSSVESTMAAKKTKHYNCVQCSFQTRWFHNLKIHIRIHSGEKPSNCEFCDYRLNVEIQVT
ncbi:transcription factor Ken-like isoform X2 [Nilaparvata lugens]|uniref:transcription factor Ken-like isoform X2 n=1 Tax=Nilaparvata lugens TaxID=108931 RepID=UPI00193E8A3A|nr:transcription factor Ken-like isoform X2 [Nilaparvata lugens]